MIEVLYISGSGRSGTTLLERMLGQLTGFITVGELRHLWRGDFEIDLCGCGVPFSNCPFWQPIMDKIFADSESIDFKSILMLRNQVDRVRYIPYILMPQRPLQYQQRYERYTDIIQRIYGQIQDRFEQPLIVDSSKDVSTLYLLAKMPHVRLHVVHMIRDSRGVAYSRQRKRKNPQFVNQVQYLAIYSPARSAWDWLYQNLLIESGRSLFDTYQLIRYEDLVVDPVASIKRLCAGIGINDVDLRFIQSSIVDLSQPTHTASGNPMRFQTGPIKLKLDSVWQQNLKKSDRWIVTFITWPLLKRYRYILA